MKFLKVLSIFLLISILACSFVACDSEESTEEATEEKVTEPAPTGEVSEGLTEITVSFDIKDNAGKNIYHVANYTYKGFNPSILGVLDQYFKVEIDEYIATYEDDPTMLEWVGDYYAENGQYWAALKGLKFNDVDGNDISVRDLMKESNASLFQSYLIESMSKHILADGETFTVVLVGKAVVE